MTEPIFHRVTHDLASHGHHNQEEPMIATLVARIEQDAHAAGHTVDQALHDVLTHHLTIAAMAAHVADEIAVIQNNPLTPLAERYGGLPPAAITTVTHVVDALAAGLDGLTGGAGSQPEPAPAAS